jgi:hypothetical protein
MSGLDSLPLLTTQSPWSAKRADFDGRSGAALGVGLSTLAGSPTESGLGSARTDISTMTKIMSAPTRPATPNTAGARPPKRGCGGVSGGGSREGVVMVPSD